MGNQIQTNIENGIPNGVRKKVGRAIDSSNFQMVGRFRALRARGFSFSFVLGVGVMESRHEGFLLFIVQCTGL